jgi:aerobic carbon-monoxide dehydrogenase small subunit
VSLRLTVNGVPEEVRADGLATLLDVLREDLGLRGAKPGCGEGRCGACTVLVDGAPVVACLYPAALAEGREVRTVEGLAGAEEPLAPLQEALLEHGGVQCGACIPGVLMALTAALEDGGLGSEEEVRAALAGNICRCTGYRHIIDAALAVGRGA